MYQRKIDYLLRKRFVELLDVFWSDGSPDLSHNFFYLFFRYIYTHSYQKIHQIIKKSVTDMKPFKFASCLRKPHLSSSRRLEEI